MPGVAMAGYFSLQTAGYIIKQADAFGQLEARVKRYSDSLGDAESNYNCLLDIPAPLARRWRHQWEYLPRYLDRSRKWALAPSKSYD